MEGDTSLSPTAQPSLLLPAAEGPSGADGPAVQDLHQPVLFGDLPSPVAPAAPFPSPPPRSTAAPTLPSAALRASFNLCLVEPSPEGTSSNSIWKSGGEAMVANEGSAAPALISSLEAGTLDANNCLQATSSCNSSSSHLAELGILSPKSFASHQNQANWTLSSYRSSRSSGGPITPGSSEVASTSSKIFGGRRHRSSQRSSQSDLLSDAEVVGALTEQISFKGIEDLLRGVRLCRVMQGGAKIFGKSLGSAETYKLSERVSSIKYFLSHNWSVSRWDKLLALGFKFNFHAAFAVGLFSCALLAILGYFGFLPYLPIGDAGPNAHAAGYVARLVVPVVMGGTLLFGKDVVRLFGCNGPLVFLDKVCIHQTDLALQKDAIARLGAFLRASDRMMILYSDVYLRKLWTIYEVANFLTLRSMDDIDLVPVIFPRSLLFMFPLSLVYHSLMLPVRYYRSVGLLQYVALATAAFVHLSIVRRWANHKASTQEMLAKFEVQHCMCSVESDRAVIYRKIAALMRATRRVDRNASTEESLEAFNREVRSRMPAVFRRFLADMNFRYADYLFIGVPLVLSQSADYLAQTGTRSMHAVLAGRTHELLWFFTLWPLNFVFTEALVCKFPKLTGWRETAWVCTSVACGGVPSSILHVILMPWEIRAYDDEMAFYSFVTMVAIVCGMTFLLVLGRYLYAQRASQQKEEPDRLWEQQQPQQQQQLEKQPQQQQQQQPDQVHEQQEAEQPHPKIVEEKAPSERTSVRSVLTTSGGGGESLEENPYSEVTAL